MSQTSRFSYRNERWAKTRAKGRIRFLIVNCALGWGISTAIFWLILMRFFTPSYRISMLPLAFSLFPLGGLAWGHFVWKTNERAFLAGGSQR